MEESSWVSVRVCVCADDGPFCVDNNNRASGTICSTVLYCTVLKSSRGTLRTARGDRTILHGIHLTGHVLGDSLQLCARVLVNHESCNSWFTLHDLCVCTRVCVCVICCVCVCVCVPAARSSYTRRSTPLVRWRWRGASLRGGGLPLGGAIDRDWYRLSN